jgi:hypothetical protein
MENSMEASSNAGDIPHILSLFDPAFTEEARSALLHSLRELERPARQLMRTRLRPAEFTEVRAVADACAAARDILSLLRDEPQDLSTGPSPLMHQDRR